MDGAFNSRSVEILVDVAAAAVCAAAMLFVASAVPAVPSVPAAIVAFLVVLVGLRLIPAGQIAWRLMPFDAAPIEAEEEVSELLLTLDQMIQPSAADTDRNDASLPRDELLLDDVLDRIGPHSQVVRLFDPGAMPTAGQLKASVDRHLRLNPMISAPPDASQALSDALAQLRRSLR